MGRADQAQRDVVRLRRVTVDDFGLIAHAALDVAPGLTVVSGETGSGKTMLLGALRFALGERADADLVRQGAPRARVVLELEPDGMLRAALAEHGITLADDDDCIVVRELQPAGRSQARINGVAVSASQLRALTAPIVDIVGQHDAQRLAAPGYALDVLDRFGGDAHAALVAEVRDAARALEAVRRERDALRDADGRALAQLDYARFALTEIEDAALEDGEDERLRERREVLANAQKIAAALGAAQLALDDEGGAVDTAGSAARALGPIARYGETFAQIAASLVALQGELTEIGARLSRERDAVEVEPDELETVLGRLERIERLKKKYGGSLAAVQAARATFAASIASDETRDERLAELERHLAALDSRLAGAAARLSAARRELAADLEARTTAELAALAMPAARFRVALEPLARAGAGGAESAEFRLAPNPGEPERPLAKSASGGELSRVLLALAVVTADRGERAALIFDEIDAGIGGATASAVGVRLGRLARAAQVVVVTHLAQIASWADAHHSLRKREDGGVTTVELQTLGAAEARLEEIARMLSGEATAVSLHHAATLVAGVRSA